MAEIDADRRWILARARQAAAALAEGRSDAVSFAPPEIQSEVERWRRRVERSGANLNFERWLLGLLTLSCLPRPPAHASVAHTACEPAERRRGA